MWADRYAGGTTPGVWVGFYLLHRRSIPLLLTAASSAGFGKTVQRRYWRDVRRSKGLSQFKRPLSSNEFDVQILEVYDDSYLGTFMSYSWPLTNQSKQAFLRHSVNYIATMWVAFNSAAVDRRRLVGPWNRPDKAIEQAAVQFVRRRLTREGFTVSSRETEICGYDLRATRNGQELHVEVKGCAGRNPTFFLTRTELRESERDKRWRLAVVCRATSKPEMDGYLAGNRLKRKFALEPTQWFATSRRRQG